MKPSYDSIDPYRPPELDTILPSPAAPRRAEMTLKILAVVTVILSLMAFTGGFSQMLTSLAPDFFVLRNQKTGNDDLDAAQELWRNGMIMINTKYALLRGPIGLLRFLVGGLGLAAAFFVLRLPRTRRQLLLSAFLAAIAVEALSVIPDTIIGWESLSVAESIAQQASQGASTINVEATFRYTTIAGIVLAMILTLAKFGFFVFGLLTVRKPEFAPLFADETPPQTEETIPAQLA